MALARLMYRRVGSAGLEDFSRSRLFPIDDIGLRLWCAVAPIPDGLGGTTTSQKGVSMWQWTCFKQGLPVFSALVTVAVLVTVPNPSQARPSLGTACASCHGNPTLATSPADGGSLDFGKTLVGQTALQQYAITNATVNAPFNGGGFGGSFPTPAAPFGLSGAPVIVGDTQNASGYLTPLMPSKSRSYEYKPTQRGADSTTISFTPANGYSSAPPTSTVTLKGQGVAPLISVTTASAGNVRLGTSANAGVTITNNGDGNQSGLGVASNLNGTVSALASTFVGGGGDFSLADAAATTFAFAFTPTTRGAAAADVTINAANGSDDGQNLAQQINASVVGQGVAWSARTSRRAARSTSGTSKKGRVSRSCLRFRSHAGRPGRADPPDVALLQLHGY